MSWDQDSRSTFEKNQAKQRYNKYAYDQCKIYVRKGGRDVIQQLAEAAGMSMAEYIRHVIICDAARRGYDVRAALGGGGVDAVTSTGDAFAEFHQILGDWARTVTDQYGRI